LEVHLQFAGLNLPPLRARGLEMISNMTKGLTKSGNLQGSAPMNSSPRHILGSETGPCYQHCRMVCNEAILTVGRDWRVSSFSEGAQQLFGYSAAEVTGLPLDLLLKDRTAELIRIKQLLEAGGDAREFESVMLGKSGSEIPVRLSALLLKEPDGRRNGLVALCHDLTPVRELRAAIEQRDRFFASILRNSADAIFTLDADEKITSWNKGAEAIFGYSEKEMLGRSLELLLPQHLKEDNELDRISAIAQAEGYLRSYQTQRLTKDGQTIDVLFTRTAIRDAQGQLIGYSSVLKNITEQKLLERHLAQTEKLSAIGELAAGLAHEIKNPLAGIKGAIEIIRDSLASQHPHRQILAEVLSEVGRIDRSVINLLSYAKPKQPDFLKIDLVRLIENVISFLQKVADSQGIRLHLAAPTKVLEITGDENELKQLFMNLILNSLEAIEGHGNVWVNIKCPLDSQVTVEVADDGSGIPSQQLGKIFLPFFTSKKQGTGLGLATCKRIVTNHGGVIRAESELGKGTRFIIELARSSRVPMSLAGT
jgi:PAS domain S-box-containing protein